MIYASLRMCMTSWCCYQVEDSMSFTADVVMDVTCWCVWEGHSTACSESLHNRSSSNVSAMGVYPTACKFATLPTIAQHPVLGYWLLAPGKVYYSTISPYCRSSHLQYR